jgi:ATP-dependent RNA helicase DDX3X
MCYKTSLKGCVVYGGSPIGSQIRELGYGCDILVGTPGRLIDMIDKGVVALNNIKYLVLDEGTLLFFFLSCTYIYFYLHFS